MKNNLDFVLVTNVIELWSQSVIGMSAPSNQSVTNAAHLSGTCDTLGAGVDFEETVVALLLSASH